MNTGTIDSLPSWIREFAEQPNRGHEVLNIKGLSKEDIARALISGGFEIASTWDGKITDVVSGSDETDHGKNINFFPFHTDGVYYVVPPPYVILYCVQAGGSGGETFFTRSANVIAALRAEFDPNLLDSINVVYMEREQRKYRHPLIEVIEGCEVMRWSSALYLEPDVKIISEPNRKRFAHILPALVAFINKTMQGQIYYSHTWLPGDLLIFNNRTHVHGRTRINDPNRERHLYRVLFNEISQSTRSVLAPTID